MAVRIPRADDPATWLRECMEAEASLEDAREAGRVNEGHRARMEAAKALLEETTENARRVYAPLEDP